MNTVGLITEYNPFHNGHAWHIQEAKRLSNADYCVVVMSGNFVQRGAPAILDKYIRTQMALSCGADLVLELPVPYAVGSAEYFASGAVALLECTQVVDTLCFGSESGNLAALSKTAAILSEEPEEYRYFLKAALRSGECFPTAREYALKKYLETQNNDQGPFALSILKEPNNILGIEYLKALSRLGSPIRPITIPRLGGGYHQDTLNNALSSATAIRKIMQAPDHLIHSLPDPTCLLNPLKDEMPDNVYLLLSEAFGKSCPIVSRDFSALLHYRLLQFNAPQELAVFQDIPLELADRIYRLLPSYVDFDSFAALIKTRQYTESRIRRAFLHILLDVRTAQVAGQISQGWHHYLRVLGFKKDSAMLLKEIKKRSALPLITKLAHADASLTPEGMQMLKGDIHASHIYQSIITSKYTHQPYQEYTRQLVIQ